MKVELAVCRARAQLGEIPTEEVEELAEKADFTVERIHEIERETNHDVIAFVTNVAEYAGDVARHFHFGLTSSDVLDTAGALAAQGRPGSDPGRSEKFDASCWRKWRCDTGTP